LTRLKIVSPVAVENQTQIERLEYKSVIKDIVKYLKILGYWLVLVFSVGALNSISFLCISHLIEKSFIFVFWATNT
jgi:hypothetical protein